MNKSLRLFKTVFVPCVIIFLASAFVHAQTITGKIISQDDQATMPGVNVVIKGTTTGTTSDASGYYSIQVSDPKSILVFSFIGYIAQEIVINQKTTIDVVLAPSLEELDEVIVLGYSEKKKSEITGAVVNLSSDKLKGVTGSSLEYQLQGKVAGVQVSTASGAPGATPDIRIRGNSSVTADRGPLIVVDGIIGGSYNPNDIESVTVLKDAGAISLYGSRANSGVLVVTTKRGISEKPEISYRTSVGIRNITTGNFKLMNSEELYATERAMFTSSAAFLSLRPASLLNTNTDWLGLAYKQGVIQNHNLSFRGKSGKVGYYVSGDYYNEKGTLLTTGYERFNFRSNLDFELTKDIKLTTNLNVTHDNSDSYHWRWPYQPFLYLPYDTPYDTDGSFKYIDATTSGFFTRDKNNIFQSALYNSYKSKSLSLTGDIILSVNITPWLTAQSRNRFGFASYRGDSYEDIKTIEGFANGGNLSVGSSNSYSLISTNLLRASKDFGAHQLGGFIGFEAQQAPGFGLPSESVGVSGSGITSGIKVPEAIAALAPPGGTKSKTSAMSFLSEVNYNFKETYFFSLSFRRDGSSIFGANKRWGNFGAISGSWILSKEDFFSSVSKVVSFAKLRASYGIVGNDAIPPNKYLATYKFVFQYNGASAGYPKTLPNPDLGWEQTNSSDYGLDVTFLNRIDVTFDAFYKDTDGLLFDVPLPSSQGVVLVYKNAGRLATQGLELSISGDILKKNNLIWNVGFNIGSAKNEVKSLADNQPFIPRYYDGLKQIITVGQDINSWYLPKWTGVNPANGDPQWEAAVLDANGNATGAYQVTNQYSLANDPKSLQIVGSATPKFYGGFNTSLNYKNFTLSVSSAFQYGNMVYHKTREFIDADGANFNFNMMQLADGWSRWQSPGDVATHPKPVYGGNQLSNKQSSRYLEDGSFWRIRNITLSYNIPAKVLSRIRITRANVFVSGDNLSTFTKFSGLDPEVSSFTNPNANTMAGMSDFKYPISKQYLLGLQITF
jgi:TonB-linked SusC/RagA family outer membrane protein